MQTWPEKHPDEVLDYLFDWTLALGGDTLDGEPEVTATGGLIIDRSSTAGAFTTIWISGGSPSESTRLTAHVCLLATTVSGRKILQKVGLPVGTGC